MQLTVCGGCHVFSAVSTAVLHSSDFEVERAFLLFGMGEFYHLLLFCGQELFLET